jgi:5,10-methylenetetrahydrofolate reductase
MVYGPCGGVRPDGGCEMVAMPCVFDALPEISDFAVVRHAIAAPLVLTDLSTPPADAAILAATARVLAPSCDAVLVGDHQDRPDFPPTLLARLVADAGARPWVTLACRDRNRIVLEQELRGLKHDGLATVLCVTGDGRAFDVRPDVTQVFDLDGIRLAALASAVGVPVAVPETPTAPPLALRPARLVQKQQAGAGIAVLNHVGSAAQVAAFMAAARQAGLTIPVVASVAVYTDARSANVLDALPGLEIEPASVRAVLAAPDPVAAGIDAAVAEARALLGIAGVAGVNLSGMASDRGTAFAAAVQAEIGRRLMAEFRQ